MSNPYKRHHSRLYEETRDSQSSQDYDEPAVEFKRSRNESSGAEAGSWYSGGSAKDQSGYSGPAMGMMARMGFQPGKGLGREAQGIAQPIKPAGQTGYKGLGFSLGSLEHDPTATFDEEQIFWDKKVEWLPPYPGELPEEGDLNDWMMSGPMKRHLDDETDFCHPDLLREMLDLKTAFDRINNRELTVARSKANPYELLKSAIFQNRAALKMADMDYATGFMFSDPKNTDGSSALRTDHPDILLFADICAGPGGFTEYLTWRRGWRCKGWGLTLRDPIDASDFKLDKFLAGGSESFEPYYGVGGAEGDGDILKMDNLKEFRRYVLLHTQNKGLHVVMADGGFSVKGQENMQEVLSKHLILCQILLAMSVLAPGGNFTCKLFDAFTPFTVGLIYITYMCFDQVGIYKPITSRPANSERYLMCRGYRGYEQCCTVWEHLMSISQLIHSLRENTQEGEQDVVGLVPFEQMTPQFVQYMTDSNNDLLSQQIAALRKVTQFIKNPSLVDTRQKTIRDLYLEKWKVPDTVRRERIKMEPAAFLHKLCPGHSSSHSEDAVVKLKPDNYREFVNSVHDFRFSFMGSCLHSELVISQGGTFIHRSPDLVRWSRLDPPYLVQLPAETVVQVEMVQEHKGESLNSTADKALHITDVVMVGGQSVQDKMLKERLHIAEKLVYVVTKPSLGNQFCKLRVKELHRLELLEDTLDKGLERKRMRGPSPRTELCVTLSDAAYFQCYGIRIVRIMKSNWSMQISKSTNRWYFFDRRTGKAEFVCPPEAIASFWDCFQHCAKWLKEPGVQFSSDEEHKSHDRLSRSALATHINSLKAPSSNHN